MSTCSFMRASASGSAQPSRTSSLAAEREISSQVTGLSRRALPTAITWLSTSMPSSRSNSLAMAPAGNAGSRFACRRALQHVARFGEVVLHGSGEIGVAGPRRRDALVLGRIAFFHRQRFGPVLPVVVGQQHGDGRADGFAVAHAAEDVGGVALDLHAAAAAIALLAAPEFAIDEGEIDRHPGRHARKQSHQSLAVGFAGCREAQHRGMVIVEIAASI